MKKIKIKIATRDLRGNISDIFYDHPIDHVAIINSKKGAFRGDHYHKFTTQHIFMTKSRGDSLKACIRALPNPFLFCRVNLSFPLLSKGLTSLSVLSVECPSITIISYISFLGISLKTLPIAPSSFLVGIISETFILCVLVFPQNLWDGFLGTSPL